MLRPLTLLLGLTLALAIAAPSQAQRRAPSGGSGGSIFRGAKIRLTPPKGRETIDIRDAMRKVKEMTVKAKARSQPGKQRVLELADESQLRSWFETCDYNANGWVSFFESAQSLKFTRARFHLFDLDRDGRLVSSEFQDVYMHSIVSTGSFTEPRPKPSTGPPPPRTPEQMRAAYDSDLDGILTKFELSQLLLDYQQATADPEVLLTALDIDKDGGLSLDELQGLHEILYPDTAEEVTGIPEGREPRSVLDLFGAITPRPSETGAPPSPPQLIGPVPQFHRLDIDADGFISVTDLETLMRPMRLGVRPHAVINTLDTDGDLRLSKAEFLASLGAIDD